MAQPVGALIGAEPTTESQDPRVDARHYLPAEPTEDHVAVEVLPPLSPASVLVMSPVTLDVELCSAIAEREVQLVALDHHLDFDGEIAGDAALPGRPRVTGRDHERLVDFLQSEPRLGGVAARLVAFSAASAAVPAP